MIENQKLVRIFISESGKWKKEPLYMAVINLCRERGIKGATAIRGVAGYGLHNKLHTGRVLRLSGDLPLVVEIVDSEEKIEAILPVIDDMLDGGLITIENIQVFRQDREGNNA